LITGGDCSLSSPKPSRSCISPAYKFREGIDKSTNSEVKRSSWDHAEEAEAAADSKRGRTALSWSGDDCRRLEGRVLRTGRTVARSPVTAHIVMWFRLTGKRGRGPVKIGQAH